VDFNSQGHPSISSATVLLSCLAVETMSSCCCPADCASFLNHSKSARSRVDDGKNPPCETTLLCKDAADGEDILSAAGVKLPRLYSTRFRRWLCLGLFSAVSAIASGPMSMWPTLEPILIQENVFKGPSQMAQLSEVFAITVGILAITSLPVGILYDSCGPRCFAVLGALLFAVFSVIMGLAIRYESLNWMLYYAYPAALVFGYGQNYGAYGFQ